jgi:hypothetical protein
MTTTFEERLLGAVMEEHARRTAAGMAVVPASRRRGASRGVVRLSAVMAGAAAIMVAFMLLGGGATSAYAVNTSADGSVRVRINDFRDPAELEAALAGVGVRAEIEYLPAEQTCQQSRGEQVVADGRMKVGTAGDDKGIAFEIGQGQIGADETLVLAISVDPASAARPPVATSLQIVKGPVAPCQATALLLPTGPATSGDGPEQGSRPADDTHPGDLPTQRD